MNQTPKLTAGSARPGTGAQAKQSLHADPARALSRQPAAASSDAQLTAQAKDLVGQAFFATLLKQMHDSPFKSELFSGGKGGQAFNGLYDQALSHRMAQKIGRKMTQPIVNRYHKLAAAREYEKQRAAAKDRHVAGHR